MQDEQAHEPKNAVDMLMDVLKATYKGDEDAQGLKEAEAIFEAVAAYENGSRDTRAQHERVTRIFETALQLYIARDKGYQHEIPLDDPGWQSVEERFTQCLHEARTMVDVIWFKNLATVLGPSR